MKTLKRRKDVVEVPRDIKFRAWDKENKCFIGFYTSGLYMYDNGQIYQGNMNVTSRYILMQYTGTKDKNDKEIYEGDVFVYHFNDKVLGIVRHGEYKNIYDDKHGGNVGFYVDWQGEYDSTMRNDLLYWIKVSRIVGNCFENPEKLTS